MTKENEKWLWYAAIGVGGYFAITQGIPWLVKQLGKAGGDTAGAAAGAVINAVPQALSATVNAVNDYANSDANILKPVGSAIGNELYDFFNPTLAPTKIRTDVVNGKTFDVYSDGSVMLVSP